MRIFLLLAVMMSLSLAACGRGPGPKGDPGPQGPGRASGRAGHSKAWLVLKADRGRKDHRVRRVSRATKAIKARRTSAQCRPMER
jgi:hypothetical protein